MISMIKGLGYLATWIASIAVLAATIIFGMAQTTQLIDSIVLCSILTALAIFGMTLSFIAKVEISENGLLSVKAPAIILIILVLGAVQTFEVYGWKSNIDFLFGESTQASKTDKLKIEIAQSKVKALEVGKVDINQAANELAAIDKADKKCTAWRLDCRRKARAGEDAIRMKLDAQKESVDAMNEALSEIKNTESNSGNYVHRAFKGMAAVVDTEALKVQSIYRLTISALVVLLSHLGFVFYAGNDKKYIEMAKKVMNEFSHHNHKPIETPRPAPIMAVRKSVREVQAKLNEIVAAKPSAADYEINPDFLDNRDEPRRPFIGFIDTDNLPKVDTKIQNIKPVVSTKNTPVCTPSDTKIQNTKTVLNAESRDSVAFAYDKLKENVLNGNFYQAFKKCNGRNAMAYLRSINTKCSQNTAYELVERLKQECIIDDTGLAKNT